MSAVIRKIVTVVEETLMEGGRNVSPPTRRAAAIAVIDNPFAGKFVDDLVAIDRNWRGTWRTARFEGGCGTRYRRQQGAELRQGGGGR